MPKFQSNVYIPTRHVLAPVRRGMTLFLNLYRHSWHITGGPKSSMIAAFSNYDCAQATADHLITDRLENLSQMDKLAYISSMRIVDHKSGIAWARQGKEWVPTLDPVIN